MPDSEYSPMGRIDVNICIGVESWTQTVHFEEELPVSELQNMLATSTGIPPEMQCLSCKKSQLHEDEMIRRDCLVEMVPLMPIDVTNMSGNILLTVCLEPWLPLSCLKLAIQEAFGHPPEMQRLVFEEHILRNNVALGDMCRLFEIEPGQHWSLRLILLHEAVM